MQQEIQTFCLNFIIQEWKDMRMFFAKENKTPEGAWVCQFEPMQTSDEYPNDKIHTLSHTWYLTSDGLEKRNPWDYANFSAMHITQLWSSGSVRVPSGIFNRGFHEIAISRFALYEGTDLAYLDFAWGGLFGRGYKLDCSDLQNITKLELWKS